MEGKCLGLGALWLHWTLSPLPSEQLPPGQWRPRFFGAALQRPSCWWMLPTIRLRGGGPGSGVCMGLGGSMREDGLQPRSSYPSWVPGRQCHVGREPLFIASCFMVLTLTGQDGAVLGGSASFVQLSLLLSGQDQAAPSQWLGQPHGPPVLLQTASSGHQDSRSGRRLYACGLGAAGEEITTPGVQLLQCHWYCTSHGAPQLPWPGKGRRKEGGARCTTLG